MAIDIPNQVLARTYLDELVELIGAKAAGNFMRRIPTGSTPSEICTMLRNKIEEEKSKK